MIGATAVAHVQDCETHRGLSESVPDNALVIAKFADEPEFTNTEYLQPNQSDHACSNSFTTLP